MIPCPSVRAITPGPRASALVAIRAFRALATRLLHRLLRSRPGRSGGPTRPCDIGIGGTGRLVPDRFPSGMSRLAGGPRLVAAQACPHRAGW